MTDSTDTSSPPNADWEEWDGTSPFWIHCVAGSLAGVIEHTAVYPLDTVRTHIQVACAACAQLRSKGAQRPSSSILSAQDAALFRGNGNNHVTTTKLPVGMWQTIRHLMNEPVALAATAGTAPLNTTTTASSIGSSRVPAPPLTVVGWVRLWRGVQTMMIGCIPAHALYFSSYEIVKHATLLPDGQVTAWGSSLAGAAAVLSHDVIMTPLDTMKQRLQLGHYGSVPTAFRSMYAQGGWKAFYRSFPVTLASNIPYGMLMVSTHEGMKQVLSSDTTTLSPWKIVLVSSSVAGFVASAVTTPLDRVKTALQTQDLVPTCYAKKLQHCRLQTHQTWQDAAVWIYRNEGWAGFVRGLAPRVLSHTPAVAISWTTYETAKHYLLMQTTR